MSDEIPKCCDRCGQTTGHAWIEGDCVLPHRGHSRKLVTGTHVCRPCVDRHVDWLNEIVELYATLHEVLLTEDMPTGNGEYQKPRKRPASPSPLRLQAWALLHPETLRTHIHTDDTKLRRDTADLEQAWLGASIPNVGDVLHNWAQAIADTQGLTSTAPATVSGAAAALRVGCDIMAGLPDVDEYDAELKWVRKALRDAHGVTNRNPVGRCPSQDGNGIGCGGPLWADQAGRMEVRCGRCSRKFGERMLRLLGGMLNTA